MVSTADERLKEGMFAVESVRVLGACIGTREVPLYGEENISGVSEGQCICSKAKGLGGVNAKSSMSCSVVTERQFYCRGQQGPRQYWRGRCPSQGLKVGARS